MIPADASHEVLLLGAASWAAVVESEPAVSLLSACRVLAPVLGEALPISSLPPVLARPGRLAAVRVPSRSRSAALVLASVRPGRLAAVRVSSRSRSLVAVVSWARLGSWALRVPSPISSAGAWFAFRSARSCSPPALVFQIVGVKVRRWCWHRPGWG